MLLPPLPPRLLASSDDAARLSASLDPALSDPLPDSNARAHSAVFANIDGLGPWLKAGSAFRFLMLEFAHVMIFVMAIMFCFMIALVYSTIRSIERTWDRIEDPEQRMHEKDFDPWEPPMEALKCLEGLIADKLHQREHSGVFSWFARSNSSSTDLVANGSSSREEAVASADALSPPPSPPADAEKARPPPRLAWDWLHCRCKRDVEMRRAWRAAHHFVLMYEFKRAHRLSNVKSFVYANYLSKSLRVHIIDILEPSHQTWGLLSIIGFISFLVPDLAYRMAKGHPNAFDGAFSQDAAIAAKADPLGEPTAAAAAAAAAAPAAATGRSWHADRDPPLQHCRLRRSHIAASSAPPPFNACDRFAVRAAEHPLLHALGMGRSELAGCVGLRLGLAACAPHVLSPGREDLQAVRTLVGGVL